MSEFEEYWNDGFNSYDDAKDAAKDTWQHQQDKIDAIIKQRDSFIKAHHIAVNDVCEHKAKIDEMQEQIRIEREQGTEYFTDTHSLIAERDELQGRIDDHDLKLELFINELEKTCREDKDNKIDYWRGFSECADSSIKVFYRDVGFINLKGNKDEK